MKFLFGLLLFCSFLNAKSQDSLIVNPDKLNSQSRYSITVGVLQGGGSIIGADLEELLTDRIGIQFGAGYLGFGGAINYHLKPNISSSSISLQYWHQGFVKSYTQSIIGSTYIFRAKKHFTFQIGIGFAVDKGSNWPLNKKQSPVMLMYSIGEYLPF